MRITFKKNDKVINSIADWKELGHPKSGNHWKDGRSAKEMARFALSDKFVEVIVKVLEQCDIEEQDFVCEPEATTSLGKGFNRGGCRNHDLLMVGSDCVIGIEAKVSEPFDGKISEVIKEQRIKYSDETQTRAYKLLEYFKKDKSRDYRTIGYQLFTSTRGTICAAEEKKFNRCINLVIVFTGDVNTNNERNFEENCKRNDKDFKDFLELTGASENGYIEKEKISCWIKKLKIKISSNYEIEDIGPLAPPCVCG